MSTRFNEVRRETEVGHTKKSWQQKLKDSKNFPKTLEQVCGRNGIKERLGQILLKKNFFL